MHRTALAASLAATTLLAACRNPFTTYEDEYGRVASEAELHTVEQMKVSGGADIPEHPPTARQLPPDLYETASSTLEMTIEQCRAWTLEHNLDLEVSLMDPRIAGTFLSEEEAAFEAVFLANATVSDADPGQAEVFRDLFVRPWNFEPGIEVPMRTGGTVGVSLPLSRRETFDFNDPWPYSFDLDLTISQPLLRNAGREANTHFIRIAALDTQIAGARTKLEVIRQIAGADRAYWLLYDARERLRIRRVQFERALGQLDKAEARFAGGVGPRIEVTRATAGLSRRSEAIIRAELLVRDAQRVLKRIVNVPGADVESDTMIVLGSRPAPLRYDLDADQLLAAALRQRVELLELEIRLAQDRSTIAYAANQRLPVLTLDYIYRLQGAGRSFEDSAESFVNWEQWGWELGVFAEVPLGNEAAEARHQRAVLTRIQRLSSRSAQEQLVKQEVLTALDNLQATWQRILASRANTAMEQENYDAEQGQYELGLRNSTEVLDAEDRLAEANLAELAAIVDYQIAQIDLAFASGMLLGSARVSW